MKIKNRLIFSALVFLLNMSFLSFANADYSKGLLRAEMSGAVLEDSAFVNSVRSRTANPMIARPSIVKSTNNNSLTSSNSQVAGDFHVRGTMYANQVHAGLASVVLGTDAGGDYIKVPAFLRFILGGVDEIRFMPNGRIGVGVFDPQAGLHINHLGTLPASIQLTDGANTGTTATDGAVIALSNDGGLTLTSYEQNGYISFLTNGGKGDNVLTIKNNGNVGIGTTNPLYKLHVTGGTARFDDISTDSITAVSNFCLRNGVDPKSAKCFKAVCPAANGQWTLSETATCGGATTAPAISVAIDPSTPLARQLVMGSVNNTIAKFKITETSNQEDVKITGLSLFDYIGTGGGTIPSIKASFYNLSIYNGSQIVAGPLNLNIADSNNYEVVFNPATPIIVPKNGSVLLTLKSDVASYVSNATTDNSFHIFKIASSNQVTAVGKDSNFSAQVNLSASPNSPTANQLTVLRSKLMVSASTLGYVSSRIRTAADNVATLTFTADPVGDVNINKIKIKFRGMAVANSTTISKVRLMSGGTDWNGLPSTGSSCTTDASNSCSVIFDMTKGSAPTTISAGTSKTVTLQLDSSNFPNTVNTSDPLSIIVDAAADVDWGDAPLPGMTNTTFSGLPLETSVVPLTVANISYE